jgi:hypothetical protein
LGAGVYVAGIISQARKYAFFEIYKVFGYLVAFVSIYLLSFRSLLEIEMSGESGVYFYGALYIIAFIALVVINEIRRGGFRIKANQWEFFALAATLLGSTVILLNPQAALINTIVANSVLVIFALTNIFLGVEIKKPPVFSEGIIIFALFIITRYIDVGWKLKEKSLFFIVGGLVILSLGTFLEKQRRRIIERMKVP